MGRAELSFASDLAGVAAPHWRAGGIASSILAFYAPVALLLLLQTWLALVAVGFSAAYWGMGMTPWYAAFELSGSSLLTLGANRTDSFWLTILTFVEAAIGLILVALLIAYLPTMYSAFQRRELAVSLLEGARRVAALSHRDDQALSPHQRRRGAAR